MDARTASCSDCRDSSSGWSLGSYVPAGICLLRTSSCASLGWRSRPRPDARPSELQSRGQSDFDATARRPAPPLRSRRIKRSTSTRTTVEGAGGGVSNCPRQASGEPVASNHEALGRLLRADTGKRKLILVVPNPTLSPQMEFWRGTTPDALAVAAASSWIGGV